MPESVQPTPPPYRERYTDADFESLSWHDNHIHGVAIRAEEYYAELVLDIDYLVEWVCGSDRLCHFWVTPATLVFHDVADLRIHLDWVGSPYLLGPASIHDLRREVVPERNTCPDRPYYAWVIEMNEPEGAQITFRATGFEQVLRGQPVFTDQACLPTSQRPPLA